MSARVEAAAKALYGGSEIWDRPEYQEPMRKDARAALAAADAVMFSDEAVERAAKATFPVYWSTPVQDDISAEEIAGWQEESRQKVRTVIAALKGDGA